MSIQKLYNSLRHLTLFFTRNKVSSIYSPTFFLRNHFLQSAYDALSPDINIEFQRQRIYFTDGGHVSLDWANKTRADEGRPIILITHGMTGGSETKYMKALVAKANQEDYCSVCLNSRGINSQMTSPIPFTGHQFHQLSMTLSRINILYPQNPVYIIGTSLGANYVLRYVLSNQIKNLMGIALICPPFDVQYVIDKMNMYYQKFFIKSYINKTVLRHKQMQFWWKNGIVDLQNLKKSNNLRDFHSRITIQVLGYDCQKKLFAHFKIPEQKIKSLKIKTMILASKDDPMVGFPSLPIDTIMKNPNIQLLITQNGGHLCWFEGRVPKRWYPKPVFDFINKIEKQRIKEL